MSYCVRQVNTITIDLASSHTGCAKMLQELDLSDDRDNGDNTNNGGGGGGGDTKGMDERMQNVGVEGGASAKGGDEGRGRGRDEDDLDDLLDLMDSAAESK